MLSAIAMELNRAQALRLNGKSYAGRLDLGLSANKNSLSAHLDTVHRFVNGKVDLSTFAKAWVGATRDFGKWQSDYGALAGLRLSW